ncbi:MAG: hypothetical protein J3K34DRAFT_517923 [Monoraphidium minutum]|nr:MAG: hypothetical protein J3K34DRAFT_517923 [Monoraphidium minutum]
MQSSALLRPLLAAALQQGRGAPDGAARLCAAAAVAAAGWAWPPQLAPRCAGHQHQQQRGKHTVKMVLLKDHPKLGSAGEVVEVKAGRARQALFPSGDADYAVPGVLRRLRAQGFLKSSDTQQPPALGGEAAGRLEAPAPAAADGDGAAGGGGGGVAGGLDAALRVLATRGSTQGVVIKRRYRWRDESQGIVGPVGARTLAAAAARQLGVALPEGLIMLEGPISDFGEFKVPLNLAGPDGRQIELKVDVIKARRM